MEQKVLTEVTATVAPDRVEELLGGFRELVAADKPDGLERTELVRAADDQWRILTLWRDRTALDRMRASGEPPAAPMLFRKVGGEPLLTILEVAEAFQPEP